MSLHKARAGLTDVKVRDHLKRSIMCSICERMPDFTMIDRDAWDIGVYLITVKCRHSGATLFTETRTISVTESDGWIMLDTADPDLTTFFRSGGKGGRR
jgi:hypothetical protein